MECVKFQPSCPELLKLMKKQSNNKTTNKTIHKIPLHAGKPQLARQVRIIGGVWKRTPLAVLDSEGLRPTPDRVRETIFNWLTHLLDGNWGGVRCLDLFAGTGALGFEAASRGAAAVTMIEHNTPAVRQLEATKTKLDAGQVQVLRSDAATWLSKAVGDVARYDLIFLDPPYHQGWLEKTLPLCRCLLTEYGLLSLEAEFALLPEDSPDFFLGWKLLRADKAGLVSYHVLRK